MRLPILLLVSVAVVVASAVGDSKDNSTDTESLLDPTEPIRSAGIVSTLRHLVKSTMKPHEASGNGSEHRPHEPHGIHVASFKFDYVKAPLVLTMFIVVIGLFKLFYHHTRYLQKIMPESCCLIIVGAGLGFFFLYDKTHETVKFLEFDSRTFFFYLLPPIILESAYSLKDRAFIDNIGTIILYAVVGTVINIILIGGPLIGVSRLGWINGFEVDPLDCLIFASLIAAVDPVAVLAIFQEVGVNKMLYFMVFGESLLNDAVTVVCYNLVIEFKELPNISITDCFLGLAAFLCVSLGGLTIGLICGVITSLVTKYTQHVRIVEPVILFGMAYLSYIFSELFHFSGIIGIIACGLFQTHYSCGNISSKSFISVTYFAKVASSVSESLIFIILGVMLVNERGWFWSEWHPLFSLYSILLCLAARIIVVFFLTYIVNQFTGGVRHISFQEQIIMAYGGLRGAVSFSLAFMISDDVPTKSTLLSATYLVILFTVFVQGCTIKPMVRYLNIRLARKEDNLRLFLEFNRGMIVHMTQGIEDLCGYKDTSWVSRTSEFSRRFMRPVLDKNYKHKRAAAPENKLLEMDRAVTMREQMRVSPSQNSFKHQLQIEQMAEDGEISREMMEEEEAFLHHDKDKKDKKSAKMDKETEDLIADNMNLRHLMQNPLCTDFYANRNLIDVEQKEEQRERAFDQLRQMHERAAGLENKASIRKRSLFRGATQKAPKKSLNQGIILASMGSLGVQSLEGKGGESSSAPSSSAPSSSAHQEEEEPGLTMTRVASGDHQLFTINEGESTE